jgi:iron(III) transport system substrate-binding protein
MMKHTLLAALALLAFAATPVRAQSTDELYAAAKKEGVVAFGGALKQKETEQILKDFQKRYPGIRVTYTRRATAPMVQLIEADRIAKRISLDVINLTEPAEMVRYKKEGFIANFDAAPANDLLPGTFDAGGTFYSVGVTPMYGIYNTDKLKPQEAPKSLAELFQPQWKGKVVVSRPSRGGTDSAALMAVEIAVPDFLQKVPNMNLLLTRGNEAAISTVVSGERPVSWGVSGYRALDEVQAGAPIQLIFWKKGTAIANFYGAVVAQAPHPNAARLLMRWLMSREGQELIVRNLSMYSSRKDVTITPASQPPLSKLPIHFFTAEQVAQQGQALAHKFDTVMNLK